MDIFSVVTIKICVCCLSIHLALAKPFASTLTFGLVSRQLSSPGEKSSRAQTHICGYHPHHMQVSPRTILSAFGTPRPFPFSCVFALN